MNTPQFSKDPSSSDKLATASEYALIFGAGASAAMTLATQQIAAASVPVTALVAMGLLNRHRLDRRLKESETSGNTIEEKQMHRAEAPTQQVTSQPLPETISAIPQVTTFAAPTGPIRFSGRQDSIKERLVQQQKISLATIGAYLQQMRQERNLSVQDIHQRTYIQRYALQAIEAGDLESLPEPFYVRAFIQKYAIALGLQGSAIADRFPVA